MTDSVVMFVFYGATPMVQADICCSILNINIGTFSLDLCFRVTCF